TRWRWEGLQFFYLNIDGANADGFLIKGSAERLRVEKRERLRLGVETRERSKGFLKCPLLASRLLPSIAAAGLSSSSSATRDATEGIMVFVVTNVATIYEVWVRVRLKERGELEMGNPTIKEMLLGGNHIGGKEVEENKDENELGHEARTVRHEHIILTVDDPWLKGMAFVVDP
ncbi:hypothetical protein H5410_004194, partial [Solanum commersonii]